MFNLVAQNLLPTQIAMVGFDRIAMDSEGYRQILSKDIASFVGKNFKQDLWDRNVDHADYMQGDFHDSESYQ